MGASKYQNVRKTHDFAQSNLLNRHPVSEFTISLQIMPDQQPISAVIIGVHRSTAIESSAAFNDTPYRLTAVLDLHESPERYQYSPQNLGTVLHSIHPRPRILITGTAVERIVPEARVVWEEYVEKTLKVESEDKRAVLVAVSSPSVESCGHL